MIRAYLVTTGLVAHVSGVGKLPARHAHLDFGEINATLRVLQDVKMVCAT